MNQCTVCGQIDDLHKCGCPEDPEYLAYCESQWQDMMKELGWSELPRKEQEEKFELMQEIQYSEREAGWNPNP